MVNIIKRKFKGFTLIELLVVIAIIGILATIIVASFTSAQARGRDTRRKADVDAIKKALELFKNDSTGGAFYPIGPETGASSLISAIVPNYIKAVPTDPGNTTVAYDFGGGLRTSPPTACPGGATANTIAGANCDDYRLVAILENVNDSQIVASQARCAHDPDFGVALYPPGGGAPNLAYVVCSN